MKLVTEKHQHICTQEVRRVVLTNYSSPIVTETLAKFNKGDSIGRPRNRSRHT